MGYFLTSLRASALIVSMANIGYGKRIADLHINPADAVDFKGNLICRNISVAKARQLEAETSFQSFPFRIQAFMNAFSDEVSTILLIKACHRR
jgi:hypothetical protein